MKLANFTSYQMPRSFKVLRLRSSQLLLMFVGIFVAFTLTAVMALVVFWRKSNTVFALQKCEQRDIDDEVLFHRRTVPVRRCGSAADNEPRCGV